MTIEGEGEDGVKQEAIVITGDFQTALTLGENSGEDCQLEISTGDDGKVEVVV